MNQIHCDPSEGGVSIVYDGDCPFCRAYIRHMRLRQSVGPVHLVNAREEPELVDSLARAGYPLDAGMVVCVGAQRYHGPDAVSVLALMSGRRERRERREDRRDAARAAVAIGAAAAVVGAAVRAADD